MKGNMRILKFSSATCQPCKQLATMLASDTYADLRAKITDVTLESDVEIFKQYGVRSVPTIITIDSDGVELKRHTGMLTKDQLAAFAE